MIRLSRSLLILLGAAATLVAQAQIQPSVYANLKWRELGPFRSGRSCATTGVVGRKNEFYFGATGGGVWKTSDAGMSWNCVSDGFFKTGSVGAIEVSRSNPDVVYVGMGETEIRGDISHGDGVYRSDDAGKTWRHIGLEQSQTISRIRVSPTNPDVAWAAVLGHIYGPNRERGIYKTTDGGRTWRQTLFVDERSGAVDLCLDYKRPDTLYAATWTCWRTPYSLNSGGPGSKLWKSTDGGDSWTDLSNRPGLPAGPLGKIGVSQSQVDPNVVFAMIEAKQGGLYRSNDAGATWKLITDNPELRQRPWYYTRVYADTQSVDTVYVMNVSMLRSTNGGETFNGMNQMHGDNHDLWIDPSDAKRMINGNDGGASVSVDGGRTWTEQTAPTAQIYHVSADNAFPYRVLGAQQDNSSIRLASRTFSGGIGRDAWTSTAGGESGYITADPKNPDIVFGGNYGGNLEMQNHATGLGRSVDPWPDNPMGAGADSVKMRFQWTYPIVFSPNDPKLMYTCSQFVLASRDGGASWKRISPDLTTNDKSKQGTSGGPITQDNTGVEYYCTVFTVAESPKRRGLIWAGSDDGLVHVTQNGGGSWTNVTPPFLPANGLCSMIDPSPHDPATAYLAYDNHENDDYRPYALVTHDFGRTWTNLTSGLPDKAFVRVVREDRLVPGLLYAGTELGAFVSFNGGGAWQPLQNNLPIVPVHDICLKDNDLIVATHGRGFWAIDDLAALRGLARAQAAPKAPTLFAPSPGVAWAGGGFGGGRGRNSGTSELMAANPPSGALAYVYLPAEAKASRVDMVDGKGQVVATVSGPTRAGLSQVSLSPRYPGFTGFPGMRFWAAGAQPLRAPPGRYLLRWVVDGATVESSIEWTKDPRSPATNKELVAQFELSKRIANRVSEANQTVIQIRAVRADALAAAADDPKLAEAAQPFLTEILAVEEAIYQTKARSGQDLLNYPIRLNNKLAALLGVVQNGQNGPTKQSYEVFDDLSKRLDVELKRFRDAQKNQLAKLNAALEAAHRPIVTVKP